MDAFRVSDQISGIVIAFVVAYGLLFLIWCIATTTRDGIVWQKEFIPAHWGQRTVMIGKIPMVQTYWMPDDWIVRFKKSAVGFDGRGYEKYGSMSVDKDYFKSLKNGDEVSLGPIGFWEVLGFLLVMVLSIVILFAAVVGILLAVSFYQDGRILGVVASVLMAILCLGVYPITFESYFH